MGLRDFRYLERYEIRNPPKGLISSTAYVGMEFEYEGTKHHWSEILAQPGFRGLQKWYHTHEDGSLRGSDAVEFVFAKPLTAPHAFDAMQAMMEVAQTKKFQVTKRTGFHVHLNVGNLEVAELWNLIQLYCLYEPAVYTAIGDSRSGSIFCIPWFKDLHLATSVAQILQGNSSVQLCRNFGKYSGLNLRAVSEKGSIEFRHMRNSFDEERMAHWLNFILALHKKATSPDFAGWYEELLLQKNFKQGLLDLYEGEKVPPWQALIYPELSSEINQLTLDNAFELQHLATRKVKKAKKVEPVLTDSNVWRRANFGGGDWLMDDVFTERGR